MKVIQKVNNASFNQILVVGQIIGNPFVPSYKRDASSCVKFVISVDNGNLESSMIPVIWFGEPMIFQSNFKDGDLVSVSGSLHTEALMKNGAKLDRYAMCEIWASEVKLIKINKTKHMPIFKKFEELLLVFDLYDYLNDNTKRDFYNLRKRKKEEDES